MSQTIGGGGTDSGFPVCRGCNAQIKRDKLQCSGNKHFFHPGCMKSSLTNNEKCKYCANSKKRSNSIGSTSNLSSISNLSGGFDIEKAIEEKLKLFTESTEESIKSTIRESMTSIKKNCIDLSTGLSDLVKQQSARIDNLETEVKKTNEDIAVLKHQFHQQHLHSQSNKSSQHNSKDFQAHLTEWEDRQDRKKNLIIFNVPEGAEETSQGKYKHDTKIVNELISCLDNDSPDLAQTKFKLYRIGKTISGNKPRPIKICCINPIDAVQLLQGFWKLKTMPERHQLLQQITCTTDKSKLQMEDYQATRVLMMKQLEEGAENLCIRESKGGFIIRKRILTASRHQI